MTQKTPQQIAEELLAGKNENSSLKKEAKINPKVKSPPIKDKSYYDVRVESMIPATLTFRVLAEDPEEAAELIKGTNPIAVKHRLIGRKDHKLSVYDAGSSILRWARNLIVR